MKVWSSVLLGDGASGSALMFTIPQGQSIPRLGRMPQDIAKFECLQAQTADDTNLTKGGELGSSIGTFIIEGVSVSCFHVVHGNRVVRDSVHGTITISVDGKQVFMQDLGNYPYMLDKPITVARHECVIGRLSLPSPLYVPFPVIVRVTLHGKAAKDSK